MNQEHLNLEDEEHEWRKVLYYINRCETKAYCF
jgi:hypothetical protein